MNLEILLDNELKTQRNTILIVDDSPSEIQYLSSFLSAEYQVLAATSGKEAIELIKHTSPDLILMDVMMAGLSGRETCRVLQHHSDTSHIPIIFMTSNDTDEDEISCWESGAADFITKPINIVRLMYRLKAHLNVKQQKDLLMDLVYTDALTGAFNRRYLDDHLTKHIHLSQRSQRDTSILLIDID